MEILWRWSFVFFALNVFDVLSYDRTDVVYLFRCWSEVGRVGGKQQISLEDGCWHRATVTHEIGKNKILQHLIAFQVKFSTNYFRLIWSRFKKPIRDNGYQIRGLSGQNRLNVWKVYSGLGLRPLSMGTRANVGKIYWSKRKMRINENT